MLFEEKYKIEGLLGNGSSSTVYLVKRISDGVMFASKVYSDHVDFNEINLLSSFDHPNILQKEELILDFVGDYNVILPLADCDLNGYVPKSIEEVIDIMFQITSAVAYMHKLGYFHGDIKLQNILMFGDKPVLSDFNLSHGGSNKNVDIVCSTLGYKDYQNMVREYCKEFNILNVFINEKRINYFQNDVFSIGALFYRLAFNKRLVDYTQRNPISEYNIIEHKLRNEIQNENRCEFVSILKCIQKCTYKSYNKRFNNAQEILKSSVFQEIPYIITGKVKYRFLENKNWAATKKFRKIGDKSDIDMNFVIKRLYHFWECMFDVLSAENIVANLNLSMYTTMLTIFYRTLDYFDEIHDIEIYAYISLYLAVSTNSQEYIVFEDMTRYMRYNVEDVRRKMNNFVIAVDGRIKTNTIYDISDNSTEIITWIHNIEKDFSCLEKNPYDYISELSKRTKIETNYIHKDSVINFTRIEDNKYVLVYYETQEDYMKDIRSESVC
jgi:serine/threonine protein kinase